MRTQGGAAPYDTAALRAAVLTSFARRC